MTPTGIEPVTYGLGSRPGHQEPDSPEGRIGQVPAESQDSRHKGATTECGPDPTDGFFSYWRSEVPIRGSYVPRWLLTRGPQSHIVYFIGCARDGLIKIGRTSVLETRIRQIAVGAGSPVVLLAWMSGAVLEEAKMHVRFARHRVHGEWFQPSRGLLRLVRKLRAANIERSIDGGWRAGLRHLDDVDAFLGPEATP